MAPSVPMKVRVAVRDSWTKEDSAIQTSIRRLTELLGVPIEIEPDWTHLITEIGDHYYDTGIFANAVIACVTAWLRSLVDLLDADYYPDFNAGLAKAAKANGKVAVFLQVPDPAVGAPETTYSKDRKAFLISLPRATLPSPTDMVSIFMAGLPETIKEEQHLTPLASRPAAASSSSDAAPEPEASFSSTQAGEPAAAATHSAVPASAQPLPVARKSGFTYIPDVKSMQKPDELLLKPPYYLIVYAQQRENVEVECSHSPTLQLLHDYLKKWAKTNQESPTKNPAIRVQLHQAAFGLGLTYDRLTLRVDRSSDNYFLVTPTVILSLVEAALGYERVSVQGCVWTFRKDTELRKF